MNKVDATEIIFSFFLYGFFVSLIISIFLIHIFFVPKQEENVKGCLHYAIVHGTKECTDYAK